MRKQLSHNVKLSLSTFLCSKHCPYTQQETFMRLKSYVIILNYFLHRLQVFVSREGLHFLRSLPPDCSIFLYSFNRVFVRIMICAMCILHRTRYLFVSCLFDSVSVTVDLYTMQQINQAFSLKVTTFSLLAVTHFVLLLCSLIIFRQHMLFIFKIICLLLGIHIQLQLTRKAFLMMILFSVLIWGKFASIKERRDLAMCVEK